MKSLITLIAALLITLTSFAQGRGINYKAILKDTNGNVLAGTFMNVQFTIHQNSATGTIVYQEDHNYTTDANGMVILNIGTDSSPSIGVFNDIDWAADLYFLQVTMTYSGGTINFDATQFMAVPYAKHAKTAENVFSGDYNDLTNKPSFGLEQTSSGSTSGWQLVGESLTKGEIGINALDLSISGFAGSSNNGAIGESSVAMGFSTKALGVCSSAMGYNTTALGAYSTVIGRHNVGEGGTNSYNPSISPLFEIGNGTADDSRSNALTVYGNGNAKFDGKIQTTATGSANMVPIAYGTIDSAGTVLSGTGNFSVKIEPASPTTFLIDVPGETLSHTNSSTLVTPLAGVFRTASITHLNGDVRVYIFNSSGTQVTNTFQFVIYRL